jgi:hypothetical protein
MKAGVIWVLTILTTAAPLSGQQAAGRRPAAWRDIQGFNIVLVVGESQRGTPANEDVPGGARKALNDMREFLPYKHYRVVDSQWTSCCSPELVRMGMPIGGRLQGVTGANRGGATVLLPSSYGFILSISEASDGSRIPVRFSLRRDDSGPTRSSQATTANRARENRAADLHAEIETLRQQIREMQKRIEVGLAKELELRPLKDRHAQLERRLADTVTEISGYARGGISGHGSLVTPESIIDSSFTMEVGETVVVGTSRIGGDKALIALVTAVRRSTSR